MPGQISKRWSNFFSRSAVKARNNLGVVLSSDRTKVKKVRNREIECYDDYYASTQYDKLPAWDESVARDGEYIAVRKRQPRIIFNFAKVLVDRVSAKLVGAAVFPSLQVESDPDTSTFIKLIIKASKLKSRSLDAVRLMCLSGSSLLRYYLVDGSIMMRAYHSKYCYPTFKPNGKLQAVTIKYTYFDENDLDFQGNGKEKWYRLDLTEMSDILYDNPEFKPQVDPTFNIVSQSNHNLGFVQAEWFRTAEDEHSPDGVSLVADVLDFIDELNYNLSQSSQAIGYGQEPQMTFSGLDSDDIDNVIKSSQKAWNLGRDGEAKFVEPTMNGVKAAGEFRDKIRLGIQDVARILLLDPEKIVGSAQSGKAMEVLHGPLIELIDEIRPEVEDRLVEIITKMAVTILKMRDQGLETDVIVPDGYQPQSLTMTCAWPPLFPPTLQDLQFKVQATTGAVTGRLLSEESGTRFIAKDFGVEDTEEELEKIQAQPIMSPFGVMDGQGSPYGEVGAQSVQQGDKNGK